MTKFKIDSPHDAFSVTSFHVYTALPGYKEGDFFHTAKCNDYYSTKALGWAQDNLKLIYSFSYLGDDEAKNISPDQDLDLLGGILRESDNWNSAFIFEVSPDRFRTIQKSVAISIQKSRENGQFFVCIALTGASLGDIHEVLSFFAPFLIPKGVNKPRIGVAINSGGGVYIKKVEMEETKVDVRLNYGADFFDKKHNLIIEKLNGCQGGLFLFHGLPGSGKTTYIKYLTQLIKDRLFIFVPSNQIANIANPDFLALLVKHHNSVLILEDAEKAIESREVSENSSLVSNILNLSNGLLGSIFNTSIIVTFNSEQDQIDKALKRKGRLLVEHAFDKLSVADSNMLLESLGKDIKTKSSLSLAEIYNIDDDQFLQEKIKPKIGF
jgi:hypothetical protein